MPSKIRKPVVGVPFTVNDVAYRTRVGCHEVKRCYGHQAVLLRPYSKREGASSSRTTALVAKRMGRRLKRCTICAVDARGRFLVEEGGAYVMGAVRSEEEMANICKTERGVFEAKKSHTPQRHPAKQRKPSVYTKFMGAFLATFHAVSVSDASAAWRSLPKEKGEDVEALIQSIKDMGHYTLKASLA
ncbi:hypothetical protein ABL78_5423 [Leptomonas seymouri]|uniref:Uncharacterized protein n=1 Tax=Leptomonas seymouri TaxID=5684 RepID=A0A0N1HWU9_LEPSE|nr:hypothetical protein ABL78_5423 [Leptomonas seymouri]|eukprot:KPI85503.1 hypothetical protein ABL78_5423 [Leptomonas seymouri]